MDCLLPVRKCTQYLSILTNICHKLLNQGFDMNIFITCIMLCFENGEKTFRKSPHKTKLMRRKKNHAEGFLWIIFLSVYFFLIWQHYIFNRTSSLKTDNVYVVRFGLACTMWLYRCESMILPRGWGSCICLCLGKDGWKTCFYTILGYKHNFRKILNCKACRHNICFFFLSAGDDISCLLSGSFRVRLFIDLGCLWDLGTGFGMISRPI